MSNRIYTAGYSVGWTPATLRKQVEALDAQLWDIRYSPNSRRPEWRKEALRSAIGPRYLHMLPLGNKNYQGGPIALAAPHAAIEPARRVLAERPIVLLCACKDWELCHRNDAAEYLLGRLGGQVIHLEPPAANQPAAGVEGYYLLPRAEEPTTCRSCGAAIVWTRTEQGKSIPLDLAHVRGQAPYREALTHFAICEHAREWRKGA